MGGLFTDQSTSFQLMQQKMTQFVEILRQDPTVKSHGLAYLPSKVRASGQVECRLRFRQILKM